MMAGFTRRSCWPAAVLGGRPAIQSDTPGSSRSICSRRVWVDEEAGFMFFDTVLAFDRGGTDPHHRQRPHYWRRDLESWFACAKIDFVDGISIRLSKHRRAAASPSVTSTSPRPNSSRWSAAKGTSPPAASIR
jgi:hypothetical protein